MTVAKSLMSRLCFVLPFLTLVFAAKTASAQVAQAAAVNPAFVTLHNFTGADGVNPTAGLVQATDGNFYGTTGYGGANCDPAAGLCGTIFKMTPSGALTTLYNFCSQAGCVDGKGPLGGLVQATNGSLYGTTYAGGTNGAGVVFKITPSGTLTTLYNFCTQAGCTDGGSPVAGLVQASNGNLYGTTQVGGANGGGTIFKITPSGTLTTLHGFCALSGCADGQFPDGGLVQAMNGNFYGTTASGGTNLSCNSGCGTVFKVTPAGVLTTLHNFCSATGCADGSGPFGAPVQASNGEIYGTTQTGGITNIANCVPFGCGTVFELGPSGAFRTLYDFCAQGVCDGSSPVANMIVAASGNLYGTTPTTIFEITPTGTFTTLYRFCSQGGCSDGASPNALVQATNGIFYGTTGAFGANGYGTVFALYTGEPPFVEIRPTIGVVGEVTTIVGYGLKGATSVTFNGTPATILYNAPTAILAKVPVAATTGKVEVITPHGTLSSNLPFEVVP